MRQGDDSLTVRAMGVPGAGSVVYVDGEASDADGVDVPILYDPTNVYVRIVAQDGVTFRNYTLRVRCGHCEDADGGGDGAPIGAPTTSLTSSVWLMLVLLVAAVTLCCLSLLVCIRMHCLRVQQRRHMMAAREEAGPQLSPEEVTRTRTRTLTLTLT